MTIRPRLLVSAVALSASLLALGGCGDDDETETNTGGTTEPTNEAPGTSDAPETTDAPDTTAAPSDDSGSDDPYGY
jgi:hypothetical protein